MLGKIGFLLFIIGAAGMDSPNITVPVIMIAVGLTILLVTSLKKTGPATADQSNAEPINNITMLFLSV